MSVLAVLFLVVGATVGADLGYDIAEAKEGGTGKLPCNLSPVHSPDKVNLVLWFRGNSDSPFYKYDVRGVRPQHWNDPSLGERYFLQVLDDEKALLTVGPAKLSDDGIYHCRVEFSRSPTRITHVNLTVIGG